MKLGYLLSLAALGCLAVPVFSAFSRESSSGEGAEVGQKIPQFTVPMTAVFDSHANKVVTCYLIVGVKCGATPAYVKRIKALEDEFRPKGVDIVYIFPNKTESAEEKMGWHEKNAFRGAMIDDEGAKIAKSLDCKQTATAIVCDKEGKILYRGGIDDNGDEKAVQQRYVAEALNEHLAGKPVSVTTAKAFG